VILVIDVVLPDLSLPKMPYGTHQVPWDLRILLFKGGAAINRSKVIELLDSEALGTPHLERIPMVEKLHAAICAKLDRGISPATITVQLTSLWNYVSWIDEAGAELSFERSIQSYKAWTEVLLNRVRIAKDLSERTAYYYSAAVADILARAQELPEKRARGGDKRSPGSVLLRMTRIRAPQTRKRVLGTAANKLNLQHTFEFGHFLADLCLGINSAAVRGPLPLHISLSDGRTVIVAGGLKDLDLDTQSIQRPSKRVRAIRARAALSANVKAIDDPKRFSLFNLRVQSELLIFVAQTGMNLGQAAKLRRDTYRWQTVGDDLLAFRVYKGRRSGEAVFRCFRAYRIHWKRYLAWLDETGLSKSHDRLFPFLYSGKIPASYRDPNFKSVREAAAALGLNHICARSLRKARVNWLLRRSRDANQTAEQAAHSKQTLLKNYEQPHHQIAAAEILQFHTATDPTFAPPGPGVCVDDGRAPIPIANTPVEAPIPDCVSPEGCLFCIHHRDVMSADYCWKLASHAKLKTLEVALYKPAKKNPIHPGNRVIDRIHEKLNAIAESNKIRAQWVRDAQDKVRAGRYHPIWDGHIQLIQALA